MRTIYFIVLTFVFTGTLFASGKPIEALDSEGLKVFLEHTQFMDPAGIGFDPSEAKIVSKKEGKPAILQVRQNSYQIYNVDLNNDKNNEYIITYLSSGSMATSGVLNVLSQVEEKIVKTKDFDLKKIISKSLWGDSSGDLSKFHLFTAKPFIVKKKGKFVMRFLDKMPKNKITEYLWSNKTFKKL